MTPTLASPNLALPFIAPAQALKHITHNEALLMLDMLVQAVVQDVVSVLPTDPSPGDGYLIAPDADGELTSRQNHLALYTDGGWRWLVPRTGWRVWQAEARTLMMSEDGSWSIPESPQQTDRLGINASADDNNRLVVRGAASLFDNDGEDHRLAINRASPADTASLLFQTGYGGRAEIGLAGSDDFEIKVSPDGQSWQTALRISALDGRLMAGGVDLSPPTGADFYTVADGTLSVTSSRLLDLAFVEITGSESAVDIHTIAPGLTGQQIIFRSASSAVTLTFQDHTGNLRLAGDCVLNKTDDILHLLAVGTSWLELSRSDNR